MALRFIRGPISLKKKILLIPAGLHFRKDFDFDNVYKDVSRQPMRERLKSFLLISSKVPANLMHLLDKDSKSNTR